MKTPKENKVKVKDLVEFKDFLKTLVAQDDDDLRKRLGELTDMRDSVISEFSEVIEPFEYSTGILFKRKETFKPNLCSIGKANNLFPAFLYEKYGFWGYLNKIEKSVVFEEYHKKVDEIDKELVNLVDTREYSKRIQNILDVIDCQISWDFEVDDDVALYISKKYTESIND